MTKKIVLSFIFLLQLVVLFIYGDHNPFFDGRVYLNCLTEINNDTAVNYFGFSQYGCFAHSSYFYMFLVSMVTKFLGGSLWVLYSFLMLLMMLATYAFYRINEILFSYDVSEDASFKTNVVTAIFAFYPVFLSNIFHFNIDFGVFVFSIFYLFLLLTHRFFWAFLASWFLVYSKEVGAIPYFFISVGYVFFWKGLSFKKGCRFILHKFYLTLAGISYIFYTLKFKEILHPGEMWTQMSSGILSFQGLMNNALFGIWDIFSNRFVLPLYAFILTVNFNWLMVFFIAASIVSVLFFKAKKSPKVRILNAHHSQNLIFFLFFAMFYGATRFFSLLNARYFLYFYPFLLLAFRSSMDILGHYFVLLNKQRLKRLIYITVMFLVVCSNFRTFDPVSKKIFGSFYFGEHKFLKVTSLTEECCGFARDQMIYNLQGLALSKLMKQLHETLLEEKEKQQKKIVLSFSPASNFYLFDAFLPEDFLLITDEEIFRQRMNPGYAGGDFYFVHIPLFPTNTFPSFVEHFELLEKKTLSFDSHHLILYKWKIPQL